MPLEVLNFPLVFLGRVTGFEGAEVSPLAGYRIFLARIKPVLAGRQFTNHKFNYRPSAQGASAVMFFRELSKQSPISFNRFFRSHGIYSR